MFADATPEEFADRAGLRYVDTGSPGYTRRRCGKGWSYRDAKDQTVRDQQLRRRFDALAIPPAWTEVWICPDPDGHIQATGRDEAGRLQYRYHPEWSRVRGEAKFDSLVRFGALLPLIRERVDNGLRRKSLDRERVLAVVVALLDRTLIRIGNLEYREKNESRGLTTLQVDDVVANSRSLRFEFVGKGGIEHLVWLTDRRLARVVSRCQQLPGQDLFCWVEGDRVTPVRSDDVNSWLAETTETNVTAKTFRTWGGTVRAAAVLAERERPEDELGRRRVVNKALDDVAEALRNTRAVCKSSYVAPAVIRAFEDGTLPQRFATGLEVEHQGLHDDERGALGVLTSA